MDIRRKQNIGFHLDYGAQMKGQRQSWRGHKKS